MKKSLLISRGKLNYAIVSRHRTSIHGYFKVKIRFLNGTQYFYYNLLDLQKKTEQLS